MAHLKTERWIGAIAATVLGMALLATLSGCGSSATTTGTTTSAGASTTSTDTAKASLAAAASSLSTMAPDAKLLVVQTAEAVTPTSTPVWAYLFGSPKTDATYLVYAANGKAMDASEYGTAGLTADQWTAVPDTSAWKIDSDIAFQKAFAAVSSGGTPTSYSMGLQTYVPPSTSTTDTGKAFVWYVSVDQDAKTSNVEVDAGTGVATVN